MESMIRNTPKIIIDGKKRLTIENHSGIITFDDKKISVDSKLGIIDIFGNDLEILYIGGYTIIVSGALKSVIYRETEKWTKNWW